MYKLLIWGTGKIAKQFIKNGYNGEVIGFIETHKSVDLYEGKPVYDSSEIPKDYDFIIIANIYSTEIYNLCIESKMDINKFIFLHDVKKQEGEKNLKIIRDILGEKNYTNYCSEYGILKHTFFEQDIKSYTELNQRLNFNIEKQYMWPVIRDKYASAGTINNYFWQDLWAARLIFKSGVKNHFDIGSRIDGFIAHLLAMDLDVTLIDIREFPGQVEKLHTIIDDATLLKQVPDNSIESMSALCSLEHFGLGRYGDPIDPEACFRCFKEIQKKIKNGGNIYISLPVGKERVEFNAHRVFYPSTIIQEFSEMELIEYSCTAQGEIEYNVELNKYDEDRHDGNYRYGLFHFRKNKE